MGFLSKIIGGSIAEPLDALANVFDKLFTTDKEKLAAQAVLEKLRQEPAILQAEINKVEARHLSIFVAGWRAFIGWVCGVGLAYSFILRPFLIACHIHAIPLDSAALHTLVLALLGLRGFETLKKFKNKD